MANRTQANGVNHHIRDSTTEAGPSRDGDDLDGLVGVDIDAVRAPADYYSLLNVPHDAPTSQVRASYLKLSLHFHPDKQPEHLRKQAKTRFEAIQRAYEVLIDPKKRHIYDRMGEEGLQGQWALGPRGLTEDEFKAWFDKQIRRGQMEEVERMIRTSSITTVGVMGYGAWGVGNPKSPNPKYRVAPFIQRFSTKQTFKMDLPSVGPFLEAPLSSLWSNEELDYDEPKAGQEQQYPVLSITAGMSGDRADLPGLDPAPVMTIARPIVSAKVSHHFPALPPGKKTSINTLLQGSSVYVDHKLYPSRVTQVGLTRNILDNNVTIRGTFGANPALLPPTISVELARAINRRVSFFASYRSRQFAYPDFLYPLLGFGRPVKIAGGQEVFTIGLSVNPKLVFASSKSRTGQTVLKPEKSGESWTVALSATQYDLPGIQFSGRKTFFPFTRDLSWEEAAIEAEKERKNVPGDADEENVVAQNKNGITMEVGLGASLLSGISFNFNISQSITTNIGLGVGYQTTHEGAVITANIHRLNQRLSIPVTVAPAPTQEVLAVALGIPTVIYTLRNAPLLKHLKKSKLNSNRPLLRAKLEALKTHVAEMRRQYEEEVQMMTAAIEAKAAVARNKGGLVILSAWYGAPKLTARERSLLSQIGGTEREGGVWVDVRVGLQGLVQGEQVVVGKRVRKAHLIGFYDPAPFVKKKVLRVEYLFRGERHRVCVAEGEALLVPMGEHRVEGGM
ncbi:hypothetical protein BJ508DRAFT_411657 [Ascobolus immersus RN42]|uniref:J domain-containing protein n=1 Tax=Ascobolus immersus RN42 TaxID=1160509 RepID=A0A3N4IJU2_ASCIM|nr:hypothetical protein BJ508DRAFT_411657 [Ascobolus immersus RN42]